MIYINSHNDKQRKNILYAASNLSPKQYGSQKYNWMPCPDTGLPAAKHRTYPSTNTQMYWLTWCDILIDFKYTPYFCSPGSLILQGIIHEITTSQRGKKNPHQNKHTKLQQNNFQRNLKLKHVLSDTCWTLFLSEITRQHLFGINFALKGDWSAAAKRCHKNTEFAWWKGIK